MLNNTDKCICFEYTHSKNETNKTFNKEFKLGILILINLMQFSGSATDSSTYSTLTYTSYKLYCFTFIVSQNI